MEKYTERKKYVLSVLQETKSYGEEQIEKRQHFRYMTEAHADKIAETKQKKKPTVITERQAKKNQKEQAKKVKELNKKYKTNSFGVINDEVVNMKIDESVWENRELIGMMTPEADALIEEQVKEAVRLEEEAKAKRKETYHDEFKELEEEVNRCLSGETIGEQWEQLSMLYKHFTDRQREPSAATYKVLFEDQFMNKYYELKREYEKSRGKNQKK